MSVWFVVSLVVALVAIILAVVTDQVGSPVFLMLTAIWIALLKWPWWS